MVSGGFIAVLVQALAVLFASSQTSVASSTSTSISQVFYVTWSTALAPTIEGDKHQLYQATHADDTPLERVPLKFSFPFFGEAYSNVFVLPNGAVGFSPVPPCESVFATQLCGLNNSYVGLVGAFVSDLNPAASPLANITFVESQAGDCLLVSFDNVPFWRSPQNISQSIDVVLCEDGQVTIRYRKVSPNENYLSYLPKYLAGKQNWFSGIRPMKNNTYGYITPSQQAMRSEWLTHISGVYPQRANVITGYEWHACPMPTLGWCLDPLVYVPGQNITLAALKLSCTSTLNFGCLLDGVHFIHGAVVRNNSITCELPGDLKFNSDGEIVVMPAAEVNGIMLSLALDSLTLYNSTSVTQDALCGTGYSSDAQCSCAICSTNTNCLGFDCSVRDPYVRKDCSDSCGGTKSAGSDRGCCSLTRMDCLGDCNGTYGIGLRVGEYGDFTYLSCCNTIDCAGYCSGTATYDVCGKCAGGDSGVTGDYTGATCVPYFRSNVSEIYFNVNASSTSSFATAVIFVYNNDTSKTFISLSSTGSKSDAPLVTTSTTFESFLPPNGTGLIYVNVSLATLFSSTLSYYVSKSLVISYGKSSSTSLSIHVDLYIKVSGCSSLTGATACIQSPGCMYCLAASTPRILRSDEKDLQTVRPHRKAFNEIIPNIVSASTSPDDLPGHCIEAVYAEDCFYYGGSTKTAPPTWITIAICVHLCILMYQFM